MLSDIKLASFLTLILKDFSFFFLLPESLSADSIIAQVHTPNAVEFFILIGQKLFTELKLQQ